MSNVDHRSFLRTGTRRAETSAVVEYLMGVEYVPDLYAGFRYDDPMIGIPWPETVAALSANDAGWPLLADRNFWPGTRGI